MKLNDFYRLFDRLWICLLMSNIELDYNEIIITFYRPSTWLSPFMYNIQVSFSFPLPFSALLLPILLYIVYTSQSHLPVGVPALARRSFCCSSHHRHMILLFINNLDIANLFRCVRTTERHMRRDGFQTTISFTIYSYIRVRVWWAACYRNSCDDETMFASGSRNWQRWSVIVVLSFAIGPTIYGHNFVHSMTMF